MSKDVLIERLFRLIEPITKERNYELYHVEYVKEAGENYLRIYIDSPDGITLEDCENVSRPVSDMLDAEDPISDSYYLEVSSPGIDRILYDDRHLSKYIDYEVVVKLSKLHEGKKLYEGNLKDYSIENITIDAQDNIIVIPRDKIKVIHLKGEY